MEMEKTLALIGAYLKDIKDGIDPNKELDLIKDLAVTEFGEGGALGEFLNFIENIHRYLYA